MQPYYLVSQKNERDLNEWAWTNLQHTLDKWKEEEKDA